MRLRTALNDFKRDGDGRLPLRRGTVTGAFSGSDHRLIHVGAGGVREYSAALSGLYGVDRSRFGIESEGAIEWFDDLETVRQHYYRETGLVETEYDGGDFTIHQYDLTLGWTHATHVELRGAVPPEARFVASLTFAPEGQESRIGRLVHRREGPEGTKAVEVYHRREHDYVAASTGIESVHGQLPERFEEILDDDPVAFPRESAVERREDAHLSGDLLLRAPLERVGRGARTTLVTRLADHEQIDRAGALSSLRNAATTYTSADELRTAARERIGVEVGESTPRSGLVKADLRALDLLEAESGARIAGPEVDPFFRDSGGYGYTWFREDARVALALREAADALDVPLGDRLHRSARFYCDQQLPDGTWPHRVWAVDGSLAPGWANASVEGADSTEFQLDQTATVTTFLATLFRERRHSLPDDLATEVQETLAAAVDALDRNLGANGLPAACQSSWEDATGQFAHTAATVIRAYAAVARAPVPAGLTHQARKGARTVFDGLDALWDADRDRFALRLIEGVPDSRLDAATLALVEAVWEYAALDGTELTETDLDRVVDHVSATLNGLHRNPRDSPVAGLVRYEEDRYRIGDQAEPKVWSVATAEGAVAAARLGVLLNGFGRSGDRFLERAGDLYELLDEDGPLTTDAGYLAEQVFDDGTPDSAAPLGRSHALRLQATARLAERNALPSAAAVPEGPTERPRWTTGAKYGLGTVADHGDPGSSRVWFTLTEGALTEARFPRIDLMNLRTLDFLIASEDGEYTVRTHRESRDADRGTLERRVEPTEDDALLFEHVITETGDGQGHAWTLTVEYAADPEYDSLVADVDFEAADGADYHVVAVADTALTNTGGDDRGLRLGRPGSYHLVARDAGAYTGESEGPLLADEAGEGYSVAVAVAARDRFDWATVGAAGSEHLDDLFGEGDFSTTQERVDNENLVLVGRVGTGRRVRETLAVGFARNADTAAALGEAAGSLARGYGSVREEYAATWRDFLADKSLPESVGDDEAMADQYRTALMSLLASEDKSFLGASIASPSVPWGEAVAAEERKGYGYNFVWSRDLYQVFTVFEAVDELETAVDQLGYIYAYQQDENGFIPQNTYVNGRTRWGGEQMDNIAFPQVMAYQLWERGYTFEDVDYGYENVRRSADYIARNGPASAQERWEEEAGYSPSSIAAEIAGLACAGKLAVETGHEADALIWLSLADQWTNKVEDWTATESGTDRHEHTPYYVRVTRDGDPEAGHLRTLANGGPTLDERDVVDAGFLELVRLGIKPPDDPVVRNSLAEVDETIRVDVPTTAAFYRYNGDGYGERARDNKGGPWSIAHEGKGRLWPLLTGERGEYELLADDGTDGEPETTGAVKAEPGAEPGGGPATEGGERLDPRRLLQTMQRTANSGRMIAEQIWDREYGTEYDWEFGKGTGSATPLAWSMAQYVRLAHGIDAGEPVETPAFVRERYREREIHRQDRGPALRVDTSYEGDRIAVTGETTGEVVAVKTPTDTALVEVEDGRYEARLAIEYGENTVTVAAATDRDFERAGTTVTRLTL
jgi:glucan 1,4-alpha-glucosidase